MLRLFIVASILALFILLIAGIAWIAFPRVRSFEKWQMAEFALGKHVAAWVYDQAAWNEFQRLNRLSAFQEALTYGGGGLIIGALIWATTRGIPWYVPWLALPALGALLGPFKAALRNSPFGQYR